VTVLTEALTVLLGKPMKNDFKPVGYGTFLGKNLGLDPDPNSIRIQILILIRQ
jgi:hypothetical protein